MLRLVNALKRPRIGSNFGCPKKLQSRNYAPLPPGDIIDIDMEEMDGNHGEGNAQPPEWYTESHRNDDLPDGWTVDDAGHIIPQEAVKKEEN